MLGISKFINLKCCLVHRANQEASWRGFTNEAQGQQDRHSGLETDSEPGQFAPYSGPSQHITCLSKPPHMSTKVRKYELEDGLLISSVRGNRADLREGSQKTMVWICGNQPVWHPSPLIASHGIIPSASGASVWTRNEQMDPQG
jgi:hypothetical protein